MPVNNMEEKNYIDEFLQYLGWDTQRGKDLIFIDGFSNLSDEKNKLIKKLMDLSPIYLKQASKNREINIDIHLYCVKSDAVDAFCFKTNNHYYIGIHSAVFTELLKRSKDLSALIENNDQITLSESITEKGSLARWLIVYSYRIILMHEYMHIVLGHCEYVCEFYRLMWEIGNAEEDRKTDKKHITYTDKKTLEMLADECAAMDTAIQLLQKQENISEMKEHLLIYYLGIVMFFSIFNTVGSNTYDHPGFGFRFNCITIMMDDIFLRNIKTEDPDKYVYEIDSVIDDLVQIIDYYPDFLNLKLLSYLRTNDFEEEYFSLYNTASKLINTTNKYAKFKLNEFNAMSKEEFYKYEVEKQEFINDIINEK